MRMPAFRVEPGELNRRVAEFESDLNVGGSELKEVPSAEIESE